MFFSFFVDFLFSLLCLFSLLIPFSHCFLPNTLPVTPFYLLLFLFDPLFFPFSVDFLFLFNISLNTFFHDVLSLPFPQSFSSISCPTSTPPVLPASPTRTHLEGPEALGVVLDDGVHGVGNTEPVRPVVVRDATVILLDGEREADQAVLVEAG